MPHKHQLGKDGESLAMKYLQSQGYSILDINWRFKRAEVDIIAEEDGILIFVEIKTRSSTQFGTPDAFVSSHKEALMVDAAGAYMFEKQYDGEVRFDVISIVMLPGKGPEIHHIKDAFFPFE